MQTLAVVSLSGGKDSTATALCAIDAFGPQNVRLVMADTGNEHDLTMSYALDYLPQALGIPVHVVRADFTKRIANKRTYVLEKWPGKGVPQHIIDAALAILHPTGNPFLDLCLWKGRVPSRKAQFCTQELKRYPLDNYTFDLMSQGYRIESWRGIRREESQNRKDAKDREETPEGWTIVHPIASWTAQQVIDYVLGKGIKLNPLYSQGMSRVGCMPCINAGKNELLEISKRFPEHVDKIREWERLVGLASKRGMSTFFTDAARESFAAIDGWRHERRPKPDDEGNIRWVDVWIEPDASVMDRCRIDKRIEWAQTSRGGKQFDFIRLEPVQQCSSVYGLCE